MASDKNLKEDLKLIEVPPSVVSGKWDIFGWYIKQGLGQTFYQHEFAGGNLLTAILEERLMVYTFFLRGTMIGVMTAMVGGDSVIGGCDFLVYSLAGLKDVSPTVMKEGMKKVEGLARKLGCRRIVAYTDDKGMSRFLGAFGFKAGYTAVKEL